jgi:hypothetical protein
MTGKNLSKILKDKNISVKELAFELCVTERAVYLWLDEKRKFPLMAEKLFCMIYNLSFEMNNVQKDNKFLPPLLFDID